MSWLADRQADGAGELSYQVAVIGTNHRALTLRAGFSETPGYARICSLGRRIVGRIGQKKWSSLAVDHSS